MGDRGLFIARESASKKHLENEGAYHPEEKFVSDFRFDVDVLDATCALFLPSNRVSTRTILVEIVYGDFLKSEHIGATVTMHLSDELFNERSRIRNSHLFNWLKFGGIEDIRKISPENQALILQIAYLLQEKNQWKERLQAALDFDCLNVSEICGLGQAELYQSIPTQQFTKSHFSDFYHSNEGHLLSSLEEPLDAFVFGRSLESAHESLKLSQQQHTSTASSSTIEASVLEEVGDVNSSWWTMGLAKIASAEVALVLMAGGLASGFPRGLVNDSAASMQFGHSSSLSSNQKSTFPSDEMMKIFLDSHLRKDIEMKLERDRLQKGLKNNETFQSLGYDSLDKTLLTTRIESLPLIIQPLPLMSGKCLLQIHLERVQRVVSLAHSAKELALVNGNGNAMAAAAAASLLTTHNMNSKSNGFNASSATHTNNDTISHLHDPLGSTKKTLFNTTNFMNSSKDPLHPNIQSDHYLNQTNGGNIDLNATLASNYSQHAIPNNSIDIEGNNNVLNTPSTNGRQDHPNNQQGFLPFSIDNVEPGGGRFLQKFNSNAGNNNLNTSSFSTSPENRILHPKVEVAVIVSAEHKTLIEAFLSSTDACGISSIANVRVVEQVTRFPVIHGNIQSSPSLILTGENGDSPISAPGGTGAACVDAASALMPYWEASGVKKVHFLYANNLLGLPLCPYFLGFAVSRSLRFASKATTRLSPTEPYDLLAMSAGSLHTQNLYKNSLINSQSNAKFGFKHDQPNGQGKHRAIVVSPKTGATSTDLRDDTTTVSLHDASHLPWIQISSDLLDALDARNANSILNGLGDQSELQLDGDASNNEIVMRMMYELAKNDNNGALVIGGDSNMNSGTSKQNDEEAIGNALPYLGRANTMFTTVSSISNMNNYQQQQQQQNASQSNRFLKSHTLFSNTTAANNTVFGNQSNYTLDASTTNRRISSIPIAAYSSSSPQSFHHTIQTTNGATTTQNLSKFGFNQLHQQELLLEQQQHHHQQAKRITPLLPIEAFYHVTPQKPTKFLSSRFNNNFYNNIINNVNASAINTNGILTTATTGGIPKQSIQNYNSFQPNDSATPGHYITQNAFNFDSVPHPEEPTVIFPSTVKASNFQSALPSLYGKSRRSSPLRRTILVEQSGDLSLRSISNLDQSRGVALNNTNNSNANNNNFRSSHNIINSHTSGLKSRSASQRVQALGNLNGANVSNKLSNANNNNNSMTPTPMNAATTNINSTAVNSTSRRMSRFNTALIGSSGLPPPPLDAHFTPGLANSSANHWESSSHSPGVNIDDSGLGGSSSRDVVLKPNAYSSGANLFEGVGKWESNARIEFSLPVKSKHANDNVKSPTNNGVKSKKTKPKRFEISAAGGFEHFGGFEFDENNDVRSQEDEEELEPYAWGDSDDSDSSNVDIRELFAAAQTGARLRRERQQGGSYGAGTNNEGNGHASGNGSPRNAITATGSDSANALPSSSHYKNGVYYDNDAILGSNKLSQAGNLSGQKRLKHNGGITPFFIPFSSLTAEASGITHADGGALSRGDATRGGSFAFIDAGSHLASVELLSLLVDGAARFPIRARPIRLSNFREDVNGKHFDKHLGFWDKIFSSFRMNCHMFNENGSRLRNVDELAFAAIHGMRDQLLAGLIIEGQKMTLESRQALNVSSHQQQQQQQQLKDVGVDGDDLTDNIHPALSRYSTTVAGTNWTGNTLNIPPPAASSTTLSPSDAQMARRQVGRSSQHQRDLRVNFIHRNNNRDSILAYSLANQTFTKSKVGSNGFANETARDRIGPNRSLDMKHVPLWEQSVSINSALQASKKLKNKRFFSSVKSPVRLNPDDDDSSSSNLSSLSQEDSFSPLGLHLEWQLTDLLALNGPARSGVFLVSRAVEFSPIRYKLPSGNSVSDYEKKKANTDKIGYRNQMSNLSSALPRNIPIDQMGLAASVLNAAIIANKRLSVRQNHNAAAEASWITDQRARHMWSVCDLYTVESAVRQLHNLHLSWLEHSGIKLEVAPGLSSGRIAEVSPRISYKGEYLSGYACMGPLQLPIHLTASTEELPVKMNIRIARELVACYVQNVLTNRERIEKREEEISAIKLRKHPNKELQEIHLKALADKNSVFRKVMEILPEISCGNVETDLNGDDDSNSILVCGKQTDTDGDCNENALDIQENNQHNSIDGVNNKNDNEGDEDEDDLSFLGHLEKYRPDYINPGNVQELGEPEQKNCFPFTSCMENNGSSSSHYEKLTTSSVEDHHSHNPLETSDFILNTGNENNYSSHILNPIPSSNLLSPSLQALQPADPHRQSNDDRHPLNSARETSTASVGNVVWPLASPHQQKDKFHSPSPLSRSYLGAFESSFQNATSVNEAVASSSFSSKRQHPLRHLLSSPNFMAGSMDVPIASRQSPVIRSGKHSSTSSVNGLMIKSNAVFQNNNSILINYNNINNTNTNNNNTNNINSLNSKVPHTPVHHHHPSGYASPVNALQTTANISNLLSNNNSNQMQSDLNVGGVTTGGASEQKHSLLSTPNNIKNTSYTALVFTPSSSHIADNKKLTDSQNDKHGDDNIEDSNLKHSSIDSKNILPGVIQNVSEQLGILEVSNKISSSPSPAHSSNNIIEDIRSEDTKHVPPPPPLPAVNSKNELMSPLSSNTDKHEKDSTVNKMSLLIPSPIITTHAVALIHHPCGPVVPPSKILSTMSSDLLSVQQVDAVVSVVENANTQTSNNHVIANSANVVSIKNHTSEIISNIEEKTIKSAIKNSTPATIQRRQFPAVEKSVSLPPDYSLDEARTLSRAPSKNLLSFFSPSPDVHSAAIKSDIEYDFVPLPGSGSPENKNNNPKNSAIHTKETGKDPSLRARISPQATIIVDHFSSSTPPLSSRRSQQHFTVRTTTLEDSAFNAIPSRDSTNLLIPKIQSISTFGLSTPDNTDSHNYDFNNYSSNSLKNDTASKVIQHTPLLKPALLIPPSLLQQPRYNNLHYNASNVSKNAAQNVNLDLVEELKDTKLVSHFLSGAVAQNQSPPKDQQRNTRKNNTINEQINSNSEYGNETDAFLNTEVQRPLNSLSTALTNSSITFEPSINIQISANASQSNPTPSRSCSEQDPSHSITRRYDEPLVSSPLRLYSASSDISSSDKHSLSISKSSLQNLNGCELMVHALPDIPDSPSPNSIDKKGSDNYRISAAEGGLEDILCGILQQTSNKCKDQQQDKHSSVYDDDDGRPSVIHHERDQFQSSFSNPTTPSSSSSFGEFNEDNLESIFVGEVRSSQKLNHHSLSVHEPKIDRNIHNSINLSFLNSPHNKIQYQINQIIPIHKNMTHVNFLGFETDHDTLNMDDTLQPTNKIFQVTETLSSKNILETNVNLQSHSTMVECLSQSNCESTIQKLSSSSSEVCVEHQQEYSPNSISSQDSIIQQCDTNDIISHQVTCEGSENLVSSFDVLDLFSPPRQSPGTSPDSFTQHNQSLITSDVRASALRLNLSAVRPSKIVSPSPSHSRSLISPLGKNRQHSPFNKNSPQNLHKISVLSFADVLKETSLLRTQTHNQSASYTDAEEEEEEEENDVKETNGHYSKMCTLNNKIQLKFENDYQLISPLKKRNTPDLNFNGDLLNSISSSNANYEQEKETYHHQYQEKDFNNLSDKYSRYRKRHELDSSISSQALENLEKMITSSNPASIVPFSYHNLYQLSLPEDFASCPPPSPTVLYMVPSERNDITTKDQFVRNLSVSDGKLKEDFRAGGFKIEDRDGNKQQGFVYSIDSLIQLSKDFNINKCLTILQVKNANWMLLESFMQLTKTDEKWKNCFLGLPDELKGFLSASTIMNETNDYSVDKLNSVARSAALKPRNSGILLNIEFESRKKITNKIKSLFSTKKKQQNEQVKINAIYQGGIQFHPSSKMPIPLSIPNVESSIIWWASLSTKNSDPTASTATTTSALRTITFKGYFQAESGDAEGICELYSSCLSCCLLKASFKNGQFESGKQIRFEIPAPILCSSKMIQGKTTSRWRFIVDVNSSNSLFNFNQGDGEDTILNEGISSWSVHLSSGTTTINKDNKSLTTSRSNLKTANYYNLRSHPSHFLEDSNKNSECKISVTIKRKNWIPNNYSPSFLKVGNETIGIQPADLVKCLEVLFKP